MRTTLTIDDDLASEIDRLRQSTRRSLRDVINDLLRKGVLASVAGPAMDPPHRETPLLDTPYRRDVSDTSALLAQLDEEDAR